MDHKINNIIFHFIIHIFLISFQKLLFSAAGTFNTKPQQNVIWPQAKLFYVILFAFTKYRLLCRVTNIYSDERNKVRRKQYHDKLQIIIKIASKFKQQEYYMKRKQNSKNNMVLDSYKFGLYINLYPEWLLRFV